MEHPNQKVHDGIDIQHDGIDIQEDFVDLDNNIDERYASYRIFSSDDEENYDHTEINEIEDSKEVEGDNERKDDITNDQNEEDDDIEDEIDKFCPYVGMEFESPEEAYNLYNRYAGNMRFSIRKHSTCKSHRTNEIIGRKYCCSLQGLRDPRSKSFEERKKNHSDSRTGCKAMISIRRKTVDKWVVSQVIEEHNHNLVTPSKRHKLRSQRKITEGQGVVLENMRLAGVKTNLIMRYLALEAGGSTHNVGFIERDARNFLTTKRQRELVKGDAEALLDYFERQQIENPSFFYSIQVDIEDQVTNFFWADARSMMDYHYFGDVVCFDPTYETNRYGMPFVPIVGINHHYQTVLFGGALLYNETEESFVWVMNTWMRAMNWKQPKVILTDQESAIGGAIKRVLPGTRHRYCLWHISRNALKNLPRTIKEHKSFTHDFNDCLYGNETVEEFESNWEAMLKRYKLESNKWLTQLFNKKEKWASVYTRDIFCASMYTTQRSESINAYFDGYLKRSLPLYEFIQQYERAVVVRPEAENDEDFETNYKRRVLRFSINIEKQAANVYTKSIFNMFQNELFEGLSYRHKMIEMVDTKFTYYVWREGHEEARRTVTYDSVDVSANCSCQLLEFAGYLCRHILKVFVIVDVQAIPSQYILKRWTKDAKCGAVIDDKGEEMRSDLNETATVRYSKLCQEAINLATKGSTSIELYRVVMNSLHNALQEVEIAMKNVTIKDAGGRQIDKVGHENVGNHSRIEKRIHDPPVVNHKGRPPKRITSWIDALPKNKKTTTQKPHKIMKNSNMSSKTSFARTHEMARGRQDKRVESIQNTISTCHVHCPSNMGGLDNLTMSKEKTSVNMLNAHEHLKNGLFDLNVSQQFDEQFDPEL